MNRKKIIIIGAISLGVILLGTGIFFLVRALSRPGGDLRQNKLSLAREYVEAGEYGRALDILDGLLIENSDDQEARDLRDQAVRASRAAGTGAADAAEKALADERAAAAEKALADERAAAAEKLARELAQALAA
ncbi:MAG: hypothetical protein LBG07_08075, partial [Treponema sp.]|nr:hypothetical protein [Treponema sp.]